MPLDSLDRITPEFIARALKDDLRAGRVLAEKLLAIAEIEVKDNLSWRGNARERGLTPEFVQDTMTYLYGRDGKYLRHWAPKRASFKTYIGVVTKGVVSHKLRQGRGNPTAVTPMEDEAIELCLSGHGTSMEQEVNHRLELSAVGQWVEHNTSDLDRKRFDAMFIEGKSAAVIAAEEHSSTEAVHTWCSRFRKRIAKARPEAAEALNEIVRRRKSQRN